MSHFLPHSNSLSPTKSPPPCSTPFTLISLSSSSSSLSHSLISLLCPYFVLFFCLIPLFRSLIIIICLIPLFRSLLLLLCLIPLFRSHSLNSLSSSSSSSLSHSLISLSSSSSLSHSLISLASSSLSHSLISLSSSSSLSHSLISLSSSSSLSYSLISLSSSSSSSLSHSLISLSSSSSLCHSLISLSSSSSSLSHSHISLASFFFSIPYSLSSSLSHSLISLSSSSLSHSLISLSSSLSHSLTRFFFFVSFPYFVLFFFFFFVSFPYFALFFFVLLSIFASWIVCSVLTSLDVFPERSPARTDATGSLMANSPWFRIPYPGQWGMPSVSAAGVVGMLAGTVASIIESVGDYYACARITGAPPPPTHAINRGIGIEGLGCVLAGLMGTGSGTSSCSQNIGAISITKARSLRAAQYKAVIMALCGPVYRIPICTIAPYPLIPFPSTTPYPLTPFPSIPPNKHHFPYTHHFLLHIIALPFPSTTPYPLTPSPSTTL
ncbi:hypothetical protein C7M84_018158 [Penaeus vannamei]|uniref:Solute carrier family 23 member 2 n=1 Tax=Penaeus vannamei TaxID=6689 RepID=A0A3R7LTF2_PENVA|nr:hypothetical protein C7M84_018158 [Penaeus vannamei]